MFRISLRSKSAVLVAAVVLCTVSLANAQQTRQFRPAGATDLNAATVNANDANTSPFERPIYVATNPAESSGNFNFTQPIDTTEPINTRASGTVTPAPTEATSSDEGTADDGEAIDLTDPKQAADAIGEKSKKEFDKAKNKLFKAWEGDREAQIELATDYLLPIGVIILVMFLANWIGNYARRMVTHLVSNHVDLTLGRFAGNATKFAILAIALMGVLGSYGFETTSLAAAVAALGFAVGMALQGTLGNFAAGIALLIFRPFSVGDYIVVDGEEGTVNAIELFTTTINTLDNRHVIIPNDSLFGSKIENWSHNDQRRVDVLVGVAYSADMKQTRKVLSDAMLTVDGRILDREPQIYLAELNASSVDWSCRVWCRPENYLAVKERVTEAVKDALDQHKIEIPFPQLDLHVIAAASQQKMAA